MTFKEKTIKNWQDYLNFINKFKGQWVFRGQSEDYALKTTLERACKDFQIPFKSRSSIEDHLIRDFRRRYKGNDYDIVIEDTLYCLALMQHYGAPTRLLDCTYSPYVAAFFALQKSLSSGSVVWCFNGDWCLSQSALIAGAKIIDDRNTDEFRNDDTFKDLFMNKKPYNLVFIENPFLINERLNVQQGAFLCPANISIEFESNLKSMGKWDNKNSIIKIKFKLSKKRHVDALIELHRMNVNHAVLFPGLDGFSQSLKQKLPIYK